MTERSIRRTGGALVFAVGLLCAWLVPDHYPPWMAFHSDWIAGAALAISCLIEIVVAGRRQPVSPAALAVAGLALVPALQAASGKIYFGGDAWMASLYLLGFAFAIQLGYSQLRLGMRQAIEPLAWVFVLGALASAVMALEQWLGMNGVVLEVMSLRPGARPFANLGQPNQLATLLVLGLVFAALLYEWRRIGAVVLGSIGLLLLTGVALTQSRAGWLELATLLLGVLAFRNRPGLRVRPSAMALAAIAFFALLLVLPAVSHALLLPEGRSVAEQASGGRRPIHWMTVIDAIGRQPWTGYGWNQLSVGVAQVAVDHPHSGEMIEHSHNLVLDLLAWNGVPLGAAVLAAFGLWLWRRGRRPASPTHALLVVAIVVPLMHSLVEFPLEYAYMLFPFGYAMGVLDGRTPAPLRLPRSALIPLGLACAVLLGWVGIEYLKLEENNRALRYETAKIGPPVDEAAVPDVVLLTQLHAFLKFARTQAAPGMSRDQLVWMRHVADRYGYPPVLFRYALAAGLNGQPDEARRSLGRICKQHSLALCAEAKENWAALQRKPYPELLAISFPLAR